MKINRLYIIFIISILQAGYAIAQNSCENPLPPRLNSVTVVPESSSSVLNWSLSPSTGIDAYIIYFLDTRNGNTAFYAIDTLWNASAVSYQDVRIQYRSFQYRVAAFRLPRCASELSNILSTIFVTAEVDTCSRKINLTWNGYDPPSPHTVLDYSVLLSVNGSNFTETARVPAETNTYVFPDFIIDADYCFEIKANIDDQPYSLSNKACIRTKMQKPPGWINADYATVNENGRISLSFTWDPESEISRFRLEKSSGLPGSFREIAQISSNSGNLQYIDSEADISIINLYRLTALNNCNLASTISNTSSNIVLKHEISDNEIKFAWNSCRKWLGRVADFRLYIDQGNGYNLYTVLSNADTSLTIRYSDIMDEITGSKVCFYVSSSEAENPYGINSTVRSNEVCTGTIERITVPNLFTPDGDLVNDLFRPVLSFTPQSYHLVISDRKGRVVFETTSPEDSWDGTSGDTRVIQDVYIWILKVRTPSGKDVSRTGTVTVYRNR
ncbi:MAG: gliding motility-associated C-terminal domain-containing protein [Bacteroidales bacterium]|nr:gliding motility-associated C-terminal domain-containing protein [Bacteroidales bacterium]